MQIMAENKEKKRIFAHKIEIMYRMRNKKDIFLAKFTLIALAFLTLNSCSKSNEEKANDLLSEARSAMVQNDYERAHALLDSIRTAYPKEIESRRRAVVLRDSVRLHEAKFAFAKADSILTFKQLELDDFKKEFILEKDERFQSIGNYVVPSQAGDKQNLKFFAEVNEEGTMQMVTIDNQRKYHFTTIAIGNTRGSSAILPENATAEDAAAVEKCYRLATLFAQVNQNRKVVEQEMVKVRFFEKKLSGNY